MYLIYLKIIYCEVGLLSESTKPIPYDYTESVLRVTKEIRASHNVKKGKSSFLKQNVKETLNMCVN